MKPASIKGFITFDDSDSYADKIGRCLAIPEVLVPNGTRAGSFS